MSLTTEAIIAAVLLAGYALGIAYAFLAPKKQHDPHDGVAKGCLMFVVLGLALLGVALAIGHFSNLPLLVHVPFYVTVFPGILLALNLCYQLYVFIRNRRRGQ